MVWENGTLNSKMNQGTQFKKLLESSPDADFEGNDEYKVNEPEYITTDSPDILHVGQLRYTENDYSISPGYAYNKDDLAFSNKHVANTEYLREFQDSYGLDEREYESELHYSDFNGASRGQNGASLVEVETSKNNIFEKLDVESQQLVSTLGPSIIIKSRLKEIEEVLPQAANETESPGLLCDITTNENPSKTYDGLVYKVPRNSDEQGLLPFCDEVESTEELASSASNDQNKWDVSCHCETGKRHKVCPPSGHNVGGDSSNSSTYGSIFTSDEDEVNSIRCKLKENTEFVSDVFEDENVRNWNENCEHTEERSYTKQRLSARSVAKSIKKRNLSRSSPKINIVAHPDHNWNFYESEDAQIEVLNHVPQPKIENWDLALKRIGGLSVLGSNSNLRFMWQQLSTYHTDLLQPFEDFLRFVIEEIQKAYGKCQELENTLLSKTDQHEREIAAMYEEMDQLLQKERDMLEEKHLEREEHQKNDFNKTLEIRERDLQDALSHRGELENRVESLQLDANESKSSRDRFEKQLNEVTTKAYHLQIEKECLRQEYESTLSKLGFSSKTIQELQDQVVQVAKIAEVDRENYRRCLRHYKDTIEEKEYLDMNISNMSHELEEMRSLNKSLLEKMKIESSTVDTSIVWEREALDMTPLSSPEPVEEVVPESFEEQMDLSHEKQNGAVVSSTPIKRVKYRIGGPKNGCKVIFVGDAAVGKSSLIKRMCRGSFDATRTVTQGLDCFLKTVKVGSDEVLLKLWDTVGQERFNSLPPSYFRKSDVVVLMYDMAEEISFLNAKSWMKTIHQFTDENVTLVLVGNKLDLDHRREVSEKRGKRFANESDALFIETSAKTNENVPDLCTLIASSILEKEDTVVIRETSVQVLEYAEENFKKNKSCC